MSLLIKPGSASFLAIRQTWISQAINTFAIHFRGKHCNLPDKPEAPLHPPNRLLIYIIELSLNRRHGTPLHVNLFSDSSIRFSSLLRVRLTLNRSKILPQIALKLLWKWTLCSICCGQRLCMWCPLGVRHIDLALVASGGGFPPPLHSSSPNSSWSLRWKMHQLLLDGIHYGMSQRFTQSDNWLLIPVRPKVHRNSSQIDYDRYTALRSLQVIAFITQSKINRCSIQTI